MKLHFPLKKTITINDAVFTKIVSVFLVTITREVLGQKEKFYFAFVDLEKAFDMVPCDVVWWAMYKLGVE